MGGGYDQSYYRLLTNALELLQPLLDKHYVKKEDLEDYIKVCNEATEENFT